MVRKFVMSVSSLIIAAFILCGCESMMSDSPDKGALYRKQQFEMMRTQEASIAELATKVNSTQDSMADTVRQMSQMNQQISSLAQRNKALEDDIAELKQAFLGEKKERQAAMDGMIKQVGTEMSKVANSVNSAAPTQSGPAGKGKFVEYKVQPGATLLAIAQAYGVSVDEIKKANKMTKDFLKTGQTIYIPQK